MAMDKVFEQLVDEYQESRPDFYHFGPEEDLSDDIRLTALWGIYGNEKKLFFKSWLNLAIADMDPVREVSPFIEKGFELKSQIQGRFSLMPEMEYVLNRQSTDRSLKIIGQQSKILSGISVIATPEKMLTFLFANRDLGDSEYFGPGEVLFRDTEYKDSSVRATLAPQEPNVRMHTALMAGASLIKRRFFVSSISPEIDET